MRQGPPAAVPQYRPGYARAWRWTMSRWPGRPSGESHTLGTRVRAIGNDRGGVESGTAGFDMREPKADIKKVLASYS